MPGRKEAVIRGVKMKASPDFWLRRWSGSPFYFESHNASFRIDLERVSAQHPNDPWPHDKVTVEVLFEDETRKAIVFDLPPMEVGQKARLKMRNVYVPMPGQTILRVPVKFAIGGGALGQDEWETLYSYQVRTEEQLWLSVFGTILAVITAIGASAPGWLRLFS